MQIQYMTAGEAAEKWNISHRRVITLCQSNRIPDVAMLGNMWIIPINATKPVDGRTVNYVQDEFAKPFVKWAGGKGQLLPELRKFYPIELGTTIRKYCEPMVGAGAVLFDILNKYKIEEVLINDTNSELINVYEKIKFNVSLLVEKLKILEYTHLQKNEQERKDYFYIQRDKYNELIQNPSEANSVLRASLFIYLNKTCFNGLYRVNRRGLYNVPVGAYKKPAICDENNLHFVAQKLQNVSITVGDYKTVNNFIDNATFVYFDPPYRPLSKTSDFTAYSATGFCDVQQIELGKFIKKLAKNGVKVLASNSDPKNVDESDNFFDDLYAPLNINRVEAKRSINSKGKGRGKISEILVSSY